jgi:transposase
MAAKPGSNETYRNAPRPKISPEQIDVLVDMVRDNPQLALDDLVWAFRRQTGVTLSAPTIKKYLKQAGFELVRAKRTAEPDKPIPKSYRYSAAHRDPGDLVRYPCGLTDLEWEHVAHLFDPKGRRGSPGKYPRRQMLDACIYVLRSGCSWRMLPKDLPPWDVVYRTFRRWQSRGLFEKMHDELSALWRSRQHPSPEPAKAVLDSKSVATSPQGGPKGYDAAKKVKGRKRHIVTDTAGLLLAVLVTTAATQDRDAALPAVELAKAKMPSMTTLYVDSAYGGRCAEEIRKQHQLRVEIVRPPRRVWARADENGQLPLLEVPIGFQVLPKRWVVERTIAWTDRPRRMNKDHDRNLDVAAGWVWLTEARMLLRRLVA